MQKLSVLLSLIALTTSVQAAPSELLLLPQGYCIVGDAHPIDKAIRTERLLYNQSDDGYFYKCKDLQEVRRGKGVFSFLGYVTEYDIADAPPGFDTSLQGVLKAMAEKSATLREVPTNPYVFIRRIFSFDKADGTTELSEKVGFITGVIQGDNPGRYVYVVERYRNSYLSVTLLNYDNSTVSAAEIALVAKEILILNRKKFQAQSSKKPVGNSGD